MTVEAQKETLGFQTEVNGCSAASQAGVDSSSASPRSQVECSSGSVRLMKMVVRPFGKGVNRRLRLYGPETLRKPGASRAP